VLFVIVSPLKGWNAYSISFAESGFSSGVPNIAMTVNAVLHLAIGFRREHVIDKVVVAVQTRLLSHAPVPLLDLDWFVEITGSERKGMEEAVIRFREPLSTKVMRQMAVVASRNAVVTGFDPSVIVGLHDMAVST
jgi:hypothetical protein